MSLLQLHDNAQATTTRGATADTEDLAAELTEAAFPIALRHGVGKDWLDRKLELWNAMTRTVNTWEAARYSRW